MILIQSVEKLDVQSSTAKPDLCIDSVDAPARLVRMEGEDACLNGMTRSLQRRLSGLSFPIAVLARKAA